LRSFWLAHLLKRLADEEPQIARQVPTDRLPHIDGSTAIDELVDLGVLRIRDDGRIDVPDIYRYGFGIKRQGGVARPK